MPMLLGLALFSPHTQASLIALHCIALHCIGAALAHATWCWLSPQSQLDLSTTLMLEAGPDPLGLLSPSMLQRHAGLPQQRPASGMGLRPSSGLSSIKPPSSLRGGGGGGTAASSAVGAVRAATSGCGAPSARQPPAGSGMPPRPRRSNMGDSGASFLCSPSIAGCPPRVPALFKTPEEQQLAAVAAEAASSMQSQRQHQHQQHRQQQRASLFSPVSALSQLPPAGVALTGAVQHSTTTMASGRVRGGSGRPPPVPTGRDLIYVQQTRLDSAERYLAQV